MGGGGGGGEGLATKKKIPSKNVSIKLEGSKAAVARPLKKELYFFAASLIKWQEVHTIQESKQENGRVRRGPRPGINQIQADTCAQPCFLYKKVANFTMRTHGVNQAFRFVGGFWLHRKSRQIHIFIIRAQRKKNNHLI